MKEWEKDTTAVVAQWDKDHPTPATIEAFVEGKLSRDDANRVRLHTYDCEQCAIERSRAEEK